MLVKDYGFLPSLDSRTHPTAVGYGVYFALLHTTYLGIYRLPDFASFRPVDLVLALLVGVIGGIIGIMFKVIFGIIHLTFSRLNKRPVLRAIIGGVIIGLIGSFLPLTLYSGQDQLLQITPFFGCIWYRDTTTDDVCQNCAYKHVVCHRL